MLKTVPWEKVDIEVLLVELIHAGNVNQGSREDVHKFLLSKNFIYLGTIGMIFKFKIKYCQALVPNPSTPIQGLGLSL